MEDRDKVLEIDAATLDRLDDDTRHTLEVFFTEEKQRRAREKDEEERLYQQVQADTLASSGLWVEVNPEVEDGDRWSVAVDDSPSSIIGFYRRLYGIRPHAPWIDPNNDHGTRGFLVNALAVDDPDYIVEGGLDDDIDEHPVSILVNHRAREHPYKLYSDYWEFLDGVEGETSFIYMGSFWVPPSGFLTSKRNAMTTIGGFCVDIDRVDDRKGGHFPADWVIKSLLECLEDNPALMPNYILLSGTGIQLWYLFGEQIPLLSARRSPRRDKYQDVLRRLYVWFDENLPKNRFKVDVPCANISHAFRAPGSPAKHHYPTRMFAFTGEGREKISPLTLSDFLGGSLQPYDLEAWDQEAYRRIREERERAGVGRGAPATDKQIRWIEKLAAMGCIEKIPQDMTIADADALIKQGEVIFTRRGQYRETGGVIHTTSGHHIARRVRSPKLYEYTKRRIFLETPTGSRYNALFGLAGMAWNCQVPKSKVKEDMLAMLDSDWARETSKDGKPLEEKDINAAMLGYNKLGALRPREQLEFRLQWRYGPPAKRNGRKRDVHLDKIARPMIATYREIGEKEHLPGRPAGSGTKKEMVLQYVAEHPEANHSEIARALGISRPTVIKWMKQIGDGRGQEAEKIDSSPKEINKTPQTPRESLTEVSQEPSLEKEVQSPAWLEQIAETDTDLADRIVTAASKMNDDEWASWDADFTEFASQSRYELLGYAMSAIGTLEQAVKYR